jgi:hypothetical protein
MDGWMTELDLEAGLGGEVSLLDDGILRTVHNTTTKQQCRMQNAECRVQREQSRKGCKIGRTGKSCRCLE